MSSQPDYADDELARLRVPPSSTTAEQSVLGALLLDNGAWDRVGDLLAASAFYRSEHRAIFASISGLIGAGKAADSITVHAQLERQQGPSIQLEYLEALAASVPSASNIRRYAEIVADRATERAIIAAADEASTLAFNGAGMSVEQKLDKVATLMLQLERRTVGAGPRPLQEIVARRLDRINDLHNAAPGDQDGSAWATPLPALNRMLNGGFRPGRVYVLAARPSIGKTALAQALGLKFARSSFGSVLFLSQEMPDGELADRILAGLGRIDYGHIETGKLADEEWSRLSEAVEEAGRLDFFIDDQPELTISQIRAKARSVRGLRLLVVDYLQLTASAETGGRGLTNRNAEIEQVSRGLKSLAKELGCAVLLLSQLNREVEKRPGKRPMMADLRDSGAIEQDADVVMMMWPLQSSAVEGCTMLGIEVAKNRGGSKGDFPLCFWGRHMRFGEAELPMTHYLEKAAGAAKEI